MSPRVHRLLVLLMLAVLTVTGAACSKKKKNNPTETGLTQEQADDLMQTLAAFAATDSGGWLSEVLATVHGTPTTLAPGGMPPVVASGDTGFTHGSVIWTIDYTYFGPHGSANPTWSDTTTEIDYLSRGLGRVPLGAFGARTGNCFYGHVSDSIQVTGLAPLDTAFSFSGSATVDSGLVTIHNGTATRVYFMDDVVTYDFNLRRNSVYPTSGEASVDAFAELINNGSRTGGALIDAIMVISFDGTPNPVATITANTENATTLYRYRIHLATGAVTPL